MYKILISLICCTGLTFAQLPYYYQYTTKDGLYSNQFYCIMNDANGFIWLGSEYGATRFDGSEFTNYTTRNGLTHNTIFKLSSDYKNRIWFCTFSNNLCYFEDNNFKPYQWNDTIKKYIQNNLILSVYMDEQENLWVGSRQINLFYITKTGNVVLKKDLKTGNFIKIFQDGNFVRGYCESNKKNYFLTIIEKDNTHIFELDRKIYYSLNPVITKLQNNDLLIGLYNNLIRYKNGKIEIYNKVIPTEIVSLQEDKEKNIWIGSNNKGVFKVKNGIFNQNTLKNYLHTETISLCRDFEDNIWLASFSGGIYMVPPQTGDYFNQSDGLYNNNVTTAICLPDGTHLSADNQGNIYKKTDRGFVKFKLQNLPPKYQYVEKFRLTNDKKLMAYIRTDDGNILCYIQKDRIVESYNVKGALKSIIELKFNNAIYIGTNAGIRIIKDKKIEVLKMATGKRVYALCEDEFGKIWFGNQDGLWKITGTGLEFMGSKYEPFKDNILSIISLGDAWLGLATSGNGIILFNTVTKSLLQLSTKKGFFCDFPKHLMYASGKIWFDHEKGFSSLKLLTTDPLKYTYENYSSLKGISDASVNDINITGDTLIMSTNIGYYVIHTKGVKTKKYNLPIYLVSADANNMPLDIHENNELKYDKNNLRFRYRGISFLNASRLTYKYQLLGSDTAWFYTNLHELHFNFLRPGKYKLTIYAVNPDGITSNKPVVFSFIILTPFWQTWWFITLVISFIILIIIIYIKRRERLLKHEKILLEKTVKERTREIELQKLEIEEKNTLIIDNIECAQIIQESLLPSDSTFHNLFPDSFILYKPKDIVSGDFYWMHEIENVIYIAVVDCTGHGVTGAFMGMIGNTLLNEIVKNNQIYKPSEILKELNKNLKNIFAQKGDLLDFGMDMSLCMIDKTKKEIYFSLANQYAISFQNNIFSEIEGSIFSIGMDFNKFESEQFFNIQFQYNIPFIFYFFSDGYTDQFGGSDNTKLGKTRFTKLLNEIQPKTMAEQSEYLEKIFLEWKGTNKQIDDVLILGIKL